MKAPMTLPRKSLQEKQDEKSRWLRNSARKARERWNELCRQEPRLTAFRRAIKRTRTPGEAVVLIADSWVRDAEPEVRYAALRQIDRHANRMARFAGRPALDDPLPPQTNVFFIAREMLAVR